MIIRSLRMTLGAKLSLGIGAALLFSAGLATLALWGMALSNQGLRSVYLDRVVPLEQLKSISDAYAVHVVDAVNKGQGGRLSAEEVKQGVEQAVALIQEKWTSYLATELTAEEQALVQQAGPLFTAADAAIAELLLVLGQRSGSVAGQLSQFDGPLYDTIDPVSDCITALVNLQLRVAESTYGEAQARFFRIEWLSIGAIVVGGSLFGLAGWRFTRGITRPILHVADALRVGSEQISGASNHVSGASQKLAEGASEQAATLEEISASLHELTSMTSSNADAAERGRASAHGAKGVAEKGAEEVSRMSSAMNDIQASSKEIIKIVKTIDEIAFQTNLLALNAAVEAARVGEAGAGFAVVADEVRSLALRAAEAAKETNQRVSEAAQRTDQGVVLSSRVSAAFDAIVQQVREVDSLVGTVASASKEQSVGLTQIAAALAQFDQVTQANAASAEETASSAEELAAQSVELQTASQQLSRIVGGAAPAPVERGTVWAPQRAERAAVAAR